MTLEESLQLGESLACLRSALLSYSDGLKNN